jgi:VWFA-related protein
MRYAVAVLAAVVAGGAVSAQSAQTPTFKSTTALLVVDVSVLDAQGRPVPNLTANDFQVKLDGQVRPVRAVTYAQIEAPVGAVSVPGVVAAPETTPTRTVSNVSGTTPQRRVVVILVDDLSLAPSRGKGMLAAAARFVGQLPETDIVGLTTTSRAITINPTLRHSMIQQALPKIAGEFQDPRQFLGPPVSLEEAVAIRDGDTTSLQTAVLRDCFNGVLPQNPTQLTTGQCAEDVEQKVRAMGPVIEGISTRQFQAYSDVIASLKNSPGLKQLVLISDGVAVSHRSDGGASQLDPVARAAAASGVQVSVLSEEQNGVDLTEIDRNHVGTVALSDSAMTFAALRRDDDRWVRDGIQTIADLTGGTFYQVIGQADADFRRVAVASSGLYQLGIEPLPYGSRGHDYALSVHVTRPGLTVRANRHALAPEQTPTLSVDTQLEQAIATGAQLFAVPVNVGTAVRGADYDADVNLEVNLEVPGTVHGPLTVVFGLGDRTGMLRSGRTILSAPGPDGDYRTALTLPIPSGAYRLRFAVADGDERVGSVEATIPAELRKVGPFLASDVLTGWSGPDRVPQFLALERVPSPAKWLLAALELYPAASDPLPDDVRVRLTLVGANDVTLAEQDVEPSRLHDNLRADAQFPVQDLAPGLYTLRATVLAAGRPVGNLTTTVRTSGPAGAGLAQR